MPDAITGSCLCGACRYATESHPINIRACHCRKCQKATGGPFYARVAVPLDEVMIEGPVAYYHSSEIVRRGFCPHCGTTLFSERKSVNVIGLTMGSLDDPDRFQPTAHIWTSSKQAWVQVCDDLPQFAENPPA